VSGHLGPGLATGDRIQPLGLHDRPLRTVSGHLGPGLATGDGIQPLGLHDGPLRTVSGHLGPGLATGDRLWPLGTASGHWGPPLATGERQLHTARGELDTDRHLDYTSNRDKLECALSTQNKDSDRKQHHMDLSESGTRTNLATGDRIWPLGTGSGFITR
jgi:hypothetical protein